MPNNKQKTIEEQGLNNFLNETAGDHGNNDYAEFVKLQEAGVNDTNAGKVFQVEWRTMKRWREIYQREQES